MKKTVLIFAALSLISVAAPMRVLAFPGSDGWEGGLAENGFVSQIFREVYGRSNQPPEADKWKKAGFPNDEYLNEDKQNQLRQILKASLREPGNPELKKVIQRAYKHAIGRNPSSSDESYWTNEIVTKKGNQGYTELFTATRNWLQKNQSESAKWDRNYAIYAGYVDGIGRGPNDGDKKYWLERIQKEGMTYTDILVANAVYILGTKPEQTAEFRDTIKRAYKIVGLPEPDSNKIAQIRVKNKQTKRTFKQWQEYVKKIG